MSADAAREVRPWGSWPSPFPIELLVQGAVSLVDPGVAGGLRWWLEGRPDEGGISVLVRLEEDGRLTRLTPEGFNVRNRVHEYGGAPCLVASDLIVVSDFATGRLHRVVEPGVLEPLTPPDRAWRFADLELDRARGRLLAVREDHDPETLERHGEAENAIVAIDLETGDVHVIVEDVDFFAAPRLSPDGMTLAWLEWRHPNMPWDGTELRVARLDADGGIESPATIAGGIDQWVSQPRWSPAGVLHFLAEPRGWMGLFRWRDGRVESLADYDADFAGPDWVFGARSYGFLADETIIAIGRDEGRDRLFRLGLDDGQAVEIPVPFTEMSGIAVDGDLVVLKAASPIQPTAIIALDPGSGGWRLLRVSTQATFDPDDVAEPDHIVFPTTGGAAAHGLYYRPTNRAVEGPEGTAPPLIVTSHGGPTSRAFGALTIATQLFTSRGFAVLDVDYRGSTGYGRDYRRALEGEWGIADVDDCIAGARWLAERGLVDGDRMAIRGGSASGYTTLCAITFRDEFSAGTSYFGLGNLELFVAETHKFESRYLERLVGPWPEAADVYRERSPSFFAERISCPVLVLQGLDDRVVPASEAERIVEGLREGRIPHAYLPFEGEDHGFRQAATIRRAFEAELSFYGQVFGFEPADDIEPLDVAFLTEVAERA
jgi:dipeptidyl aminopeptidase/acylaminoacyl peptidase